ncbi:agamous-like MADS-box protein AGL80 [Aristolochia californica]|uniref:agamous-like MADS-box protein AGL80 n=1 Tax=Aristolochia californica TaxID=171875 RepID=UPI0035DBC557
MARKKVKLAWILNDSTRRVACRKRTKGLLKKVSELSTLCGVEVAVVAINPNNPEPDIWPSVPDAIRTLEKFKSLPELDQIKRTMNQEGYFRKKIEKLDQQAKKIANGNRELHLDTLLYQCLSGKSLDDLNSQELSDLARMIDAKANALEERFNDLKGKETHSVQQPSVEKGIGSTNDSCRMVPMMEFLKEQTCFMETMDADEHVGPSNGAGAVKLFDADDLVDEFSGDF